LYVLVVTPLVQASIEAVIMATMCATHWHYSPILPATCQAPIEPVQGVCWETGNE